MNKKLKPCPFCSHLHKKLLGYDFHKVGCSNDNCKLHGLSFTVEEWSTRADEWISVHDKKPKYGTPVILLVNDVVQDITYNLDGSDDSLDWFEPYSSVGAYDDLKDISFFVTHDIDVKWMRLPSPPKVASCGE